MPHPKPFHEQFAEDMRRGIEKVRSMSVDEQREWLVEIGILTGDGKLHPRYGGPDPERRRAVEQAAG